MQACAAAALRRHDSAPAAGDGGSAVGLPLEGQPGVLSLRSSDCLPTASKRSAAGARGSEAAERLCRASAVPHTHDFPPLQVGLYYAGKTTLLYSWGAPNTVIPTIGEDPLLARCTAHHPLRIITRVPCPNCAAVLPSQGGLLSSSSTRTWRLLAGTLVGLVR